MTSPISERRSRTALVAGASGHLGRHIVRELRDRGWRVRAITRDPARLLAAAGPVEDVVRGSITDAGALAGVCDGVDAVISAAGATMSLGGLRDRRSFMEVDFAGNANLLEQARTAGVAKFVYVSLHGARQLIRTEYAAAHERLVAALAASEMPYTVVRPTGFFSMFADILHMAARGHGVVIGDGSAHTNPIDERDVAPICVDAVDAHEREIPVGGPQVYTRRQIVELAFEAVGRAPRIITSPPWLFAAAAALARPVNPRLHALMVFGGAVSVIDLVAPPRGTRTLPRYFAELRGGATLPSTSGSGVPA
ncbi:MAG TPA: SDR family oxidoreductase [Gemmatimonadaceae bacterium]|nr:SDR family oxidoreductase [Gemmatimonadaceae bacterium]